MLTVCVMLAGSLAAQTPTVEAIAKKHQTAFGKLAKETNRANAAFQKMPQGPERQKAQEYFKSAFAKQQALDAGDFSEVFPPVVITNFIPGRVGMIQDRDGKPDAKVRKLNPEEWMVRAVIETRVSDTEAIVTGLHTTKRNGGKVTFLVINYPPAAEVEDARRKQHDEFPPSGRLVLLNDLVRVLKPREINGNKYPVVERIPFDTIKAEIKRQTKERLDSRAGKSPLPKFGP